MSPEARENIRTWWPVAIVMAGGLMTAGALKASDTAQTERIAKIERSQQQDHDDIVAMKRDLAAIKETAQRIENKLDEANKK